MNKVVFARFQAVQAFNAVVLILATLTSAVYDPLDHVQDDSPWARLVRPGPFPQLSTPRNPGRSLLDNATPQRPRIFIREMPESLTHKSRHGDLSETFWGLEQVFFDMLRDSPYLAATAEEADYIAPEIYFHHARPLQQDVINAVKGPLWKRKGGADHIFVVTTEQGRCDYDDPALLNSIFLSHFGYLLGRKHMPPRDCDLFERFGEDCDPMFPAGHDAFFQVDYVPCFKPQHDILVPPTVHEAHGNASHPSNSLYKSRYTHPELASVRRNTTLFFSGVIEHDANQYWAKERPWSDTWYSFGVRQNVHRMHGHKPGFKILPEHGVNASQFWEEMTASHFCLAPAGWGWGTKMKASVSRGCIPVIIQDAVLVEFEEQLPLREYALRLPHWSAHKLPAILSAYINEGWAADMQKAIDDCAWRLHMWRRPHGRAFEVVMCELKRRLVNAPRMEVDLKACTLRCGDNHLVKLKDGFNNV